MLEDQSSSQLLDLGYLTLGPVIITAGLVALLITLLRRERRDSTLAFFGCLSVLVGLRFLISTRAIRSVLGGSPDFWNAWQVSLSYLLPAATFAFALSYLGPGWRSSLRWAAWGYFAFACAALAALLFSSSQEFFPFANNLAIIAVLVTIFANAVRPEFRKDRGARILAVCAMAGIMYFTLESLRAVNLVSVNFHTAYARTMIFHSTVVVLVLVVRYLFVREERLAAVRQELRTASQIQTSILPRTTPTVPGLAIASRYEPMTEVAGDFYDFTATDERSLGVLVADVSGHGVPAALIAAMAKMAFLAQADHAREPAQVLAGLNRTVGRQLENQFITAGYAFIDLEAGRLDYSGAAHPPLLIRSAAAGDIVSLEQNGLMLGPFPDATYETVRRDLSPGDRIVMYTDGFTEAANKEDEQFGEERLQRLLAGSAELTAEVFAEQLMANVTAWAGRQRGDDLTLVVIDILVAGQ